ncbi:hypothetical protein M409DRAFT_16368 [Zasmidium cellare ATCC 36951]|uniref:Uncharacterized protein n=1 Tax=Zasmidium cellare ATCC 36951 TaxID=1080233 RepID=A0A6A6D3V2_ZASCE|nr:uncharacterized protein M409DRAFT_16368 [Zasmidium cellare ATCC 36951]KAF2174094.1 hypothetical protein M409DRAFT_16368 [Zasmidium cellare ATCC 36951]
MSSSMPIPKRKKPVVVAASSPASSSSSSSSYGSPPTRSSKGKERASESASPRQEGGAFMMRRTRNSLSKSEYTVINLGHEDGPPRLVTCVKSSQGFDWNQELFLPSYIDYDPQDLEHRPDPVDDIVLTDEEAAAILP